MAKGYLVAHIRVDDAEAFKQFGPMSGAAIQEHGGRVLVRSPSGEVQEGSMKPLTIVVEFDDLETARHFYHSDAYTEARQLREACSETDLILLEGL
ncbi:MAG: DUF1330 domain-containing protein [Acidimicrobiia bacterium]|nr:DUF1330 domain-containing protein [Acidimicrobiia bacterium]